MTVHDLQAPDAPGTAGSDTPLAQLVPLRDIRTDGGTQARAALDSDRMFAYVDNMIDGDVFPSIVVYYDGSTYWLADGFHRVEAARRWQSTGGPATIAAEVRSGTRRDAILHAVGANSDHGLRRTRDDIRRAVELLLRDDEWRQWSDSEIARRCRVDHKTVGNHRKRLEGTGEIPRSDIRQSAGGRAINTAPIAAANAERATARQEAPGVPADLPYPLDWDVQRQRALALGFDDLVITDGQYELLHSGRRHSRVSEWRLITETLDRFERFRAERAQRAAVRAALPEDLRDTWSLEPASGGRLVAVHTATGTRTGSCAPESFALLVEEVRDRYARLTRPTPAPQIDRPQLPQDLVDRWSIVHVAAGRIQGLHMPTRTQTERYHPNDFAQLVAEIQAKDAELVPPADLSDAEKAFAAAHGLKWFGSHLLPGVVARYIFDTETGSLSMTREEFDAWAAQQRAQPGQAAEADAPAGAVLSTGAPDDWIEAMLLPQERLFWAHQNEEYDQARESALAVLQALAASNEVVIPPFPAPDREALIGEIGHFLEHSQWTAERESLPQLAGMLRAIGRYLTLHVEAA